MSKLSVPAVAVFFLLTSIYSGFGASPATKSVPSVSELRLTLREDPQSDLPLTPSCTGEASLTLTCRAFRLTLENIGRHIVHINELSCFEPSIVFWRKPEQRTSDWVPVSQPGQPTCRTSDWQNIRLAPGEQMEYSTRLISLRRSSETFAPGFYTLRAEWAVFGCIEDPEGTDCLAPLQVVHQGNPVPDTVSLRPVMVSSNEVTAESPTLPDLGRPIFGFEVTASQSTSSAPESDRLRRCYAGELNNLECVVFHYSIQNLGTRAVRIATTSCSDSSITPEYGLLGERWKPVPPRIWSCLANFLIETPIPPGGAAESSFTLPTLKPGYDASAIPASGQYYFRFTFHPSVCLASPDGSFCLTKYEKEPDLLSNAVFVRLND